MTPLRSKILIDILALLVLSIFLSTQILAGDPGVGWHLKSGDWILQNQAIPYADPFLSTSAGKYWVSNQWLADVILAILFSLGSWGLLGGCAVAIASLGYLYLLPIGLKNSARQVSAPTWLVGMLLIIFLGILQWYIRPVVFSFFLFIVLYSRLVRSELTKLDWIGLPLIFILWANLHSAFPLGLILIGLRALSFTGQRRSSLILLILCSAATLVNPYGIYLHYNIAALLGEPYFMSLNTEWRAPDFQLQTFKPLMFAVLLIILGFSFGMQLSMFQLLSLLVFLALAFQGRRYIPFFAVVGAAPILLSIQAILHRFLTPFSRFPWVHAFLEPARAWRFEGIPTVLGCIALAITLTARGLPGPESVWPKRAIEAIKDSGARGAIFHTPDLGGYITFLLWPEQRAWIDDRNELNGKQLYEEYFQVVKLKPGWQDVLAKYDFEFLILDLQSPTATFFKSRADWTVFFEESNTIVFRKR